jgi:lambda family phage portal protein
MQAVITAPADDAMRMRLDEPSAIVAAPPAAAATPRRGRNFYEGAGQGRRAVGWRAPTVSPNSAVLYGLGILRDRSRTATRNDGYAKGTIDELVSQLVGTGIKPLSQAPDDLVVEYPVGSGKTMPFRQAIQLAWNCWTDESDADGLLDYYGQQSQAVRSWLEGGDVFIRRRERLPSDGLSVPLQLQVLEAELCPHTYNLFAGSGNRVRAGVEFNGIGKRVAYYFHPNRNGDMLDYDQTQFRRVPAESVAHMYDPLRPGQIRGLPLLTQALIRLYELAKFDDAVLLRQQLSNLFAGFITRETAADTEAINPLTGLAPETDGSGKPMVSLEPGIMQELEPGEKVEFSKPPETGKGYKDFTRQQLMHVAAATGVPYEMLTGDLSGLNDRVVRVILHKYRRRLTAIQHQIVAFQMCRPVWRWFMDRVFLSGAINIPAAYVENPEPWLRVKWMPQGWPYLHPVQDVDAQKAAIRDGFTSRSAVVAEQGEDAEVIDAEQASDNKRADSLRLRYDSDGRQSSSTNPQADPAPPSDGG